MKKIFLIVNLFLIYSGTTFSQKIDDNLKIISVQGTSRKLIYPKHFTVQLYLEEDTYRNDRGEIIKDTLNRIDSVLLQKLSEINISADQLDLQSIQSSTVIYGKERKIKEGKIYEIEFENKDEVISIFRNLRFEGLKGIEVLNRYDNLREIENDLYEQALIDAKEKAAKLLETFGYTIDRVIEINIELEPQMFLQTYPYNDVRWYNSGNPKFKFDNQPRLLRCIIAAKFTYI